MFGFEKLEVWQRAIEYADEVYTRTREFPVAERFGLTSQMRRAAVSISSNIAEGSGRNSKRDFVRFVEIAYGSVLETVSQALIARRQSFFSDESFETLYRKAEQLSRMLSGLRGSLQQESDKG